MLTGQGCVFMYLQLLMQLRVSTWFAGGGCTTCGMRTRELDVTITLRRMGRGAW
jgi:hypothetical protein